MCAAGYCLKTMDAHQQTRSQPPGNPSRPVRSRNVPLCGTDPLLATTPCSRPPARCYGARPPATAPKKVCNIHLEKSFLASSITRCSIRLRLRSEKGLGPPVPSSAQSNSQKMVMRGVISSMLPNSSQIVRAPTLGGTSLFTIILPSSSAIICAASLREGTLTPKSLIVCFKSGVQSASVSAGSVSKALRLLESWSSCRRASATRETLSVVKNPSVVSRI